MILRNKAGVIQQLLCAIPRKKAFWLTTGMVSLILFLLIITGGRQYLLHQHCHQVNMTSRQLLFQFTNIKEHINEALITREQIHYQDLKADIDDLEAAIALIQNDILIPDNFKQGYLTQLDLVGLAVKLRSVQAVSDRPSAEQLAALTALLRSMYSRVSQFHQELSAYTQSLLFGLHQTLTASLALAVLMVSTLLLLINRAMARPLPQLKQTAADDISLKNICKIYRYAALGKLSTDLAHKLIDLSNGAINYTQALLDLAADQTDLIKGPGEPLPKKNRLLAMESYSLLEKLLTEEKEMSHLIVTLQEFGRDNQAATRIYTVGEILDGIVTLTQEQTKAAGIKLQLTIEPDLPVIRRHGNDIRLVLLSLLQKAGSRVAAPYPLTVGDERKQIRIAATLLLQSSQELIMITIHYHGTAWQDSEADDDNSHFPAEPWLEISQCRLLVQQWGGELVIKSGADHQNICTLQFPHGAEP